MNRLVDKLTNSSPPSSAPSSPQAQVSIAETFPDSPHSTRYSASTTDNIKFENALRVKPPNDQSHRSLISQQQQPSSARAVKEQIDKEFWMPDTTRTCYDCDTPFTTFVRRHHCRICGNVFCSRCTERVLQPHLDHKPMRICSYCLVRLENPDEPPATRSTRAPLVIPV